MPGLWHNFRTGKDEAGTPKDWHDVIPQNEMIQQLFDNLVSTGLPDVIATILVLSKVAEIIKEKEHRMN